MLSGNKKKQFNKEEKKTEMPETKYYENILRSSADRRKIKLKAGSEIKVPPQDLKEKQKEAQIVQTLEEREEEKQIPHRALEPVIQRIEPQSTVLGFKVLRDGRFIKVHPNQIEIVEGDSRRLIEIKEMPVYDDEEISVKIAELPNQKLVLAFTEEDEPSRLVILDLNSGACLGTKVIDKTIYSVSACPTPSDNSFLLHLQGNEQIIFSYQQSGFIREESSSVQDDITHVLPDKSKISFSNKPATVRRFESNGVEKSLQLGHDRDEHLSRLIAEKRSYIHHNLVAFSDDLNHFACITTCVHRGLLLNSGVTYHLHIFDTDLTHSLKINLDNSAYHNIAPDRLMFLDDEHVALTGVQNHFPMWDGKTEIRNYIVQVFDLNGKKVNEILLGENISYNYKLDKFLDTTPSGQLVFCSKTGEITIHNHVAPRIKKKNETVSVLEGSEKKPMLLNKDVALIVAEYAGFFKSPTKPKDHLEGITEIIHPNWDSSMYARFKRRML